MDNYESFVELNTEETHILKKEIYDDKILRLRFTNQFMKTYIIKPFDHLNSKLKSILFISRFF